MKMNLLEMVQDILNDLDSDEVNSISDTTEAFQVAQILKTTFFEFIGRKEWPHLRKMTTLNSMSDSDYPNYLVLPEQAVRMELLTYNQKKEVGDRDIFQPIEYLYPDSFVMHTNRRNLDNDNVIQVVDPDGSKLNIITDQAPKYWTSFNDEFIVFDSYVKDLSDTMLGDESQCELYFSPQWVMSDAAVPELPVEAFSGFLAEAKSVASVKLRQMADEKAEQQAVRQHNMLAQRGFVTQGGVRYRNFGRRNRKGYGTHNPLFNKGSYSG